MSQEEKYPLQDTLYTGPSALQDEFQEDPYSPLAHLNDSQKKAVMATEGIVRVIAGAGSGKTRTLSSRFAFLTLEAGILPSSILCVTFTNKAAAEMRSRIRRMTGDEDTGYICTFHSLCNTILLEEANAIHFPKSFMVMDNGDIDDLLQIVYDERGLTSRDMTFSKARDMIEILKINEQPEYRFDLVNLSLQQLHEKYLQAKDVKDIIFLGYLYQQKKNFALDYNDLIILTLHIFNENEEIRRKWQQKLEYIMIDEFQDIDDLQYRLMEVLAGWHHNLFVVGDPDQTVYTWRGARVEYLTRFNERFPGCQTLFLNENYRSTPEILFCANSLISANANRIEKNLQAFRPSGAQVHAGHYEDSRKEAQGIVRQIAHLHKKGYRYKDMAILYRAHFLSRPIEDALIESQIPYTIYSGTPFFSRKEIKDAAAYARMLVYQDDLDFIRTVNTPKRNIGKTRMHFLKEYALEHQISLFEALQENADTPRFASTQAKEYIKLIEETSWKEQSVSETVASLLDASGYEKMLRLEGAQQRLDNLAELKQAISEYEISWGEDTTLEGWLRHIAFFQNTDVSMEPDRIRLMTIHTAKGLEFPCVFLPGMNEGLFPSRQTKNLQGMEEERRLAFVAVTRAENELYLSEAAGFMHNGAGRYPSRFLADIGTEKMHWDPPMDPDKMAQTRRIMQARPELLKHDAGREKLCAGDRIRHAVFGEGTILTISEDGSRITILFDRLESTRTLSARAKLEKTGHTDLEHVLN